MIYYYAYLSLLLLFYKHFRVALAIIFCNNSFNSQRNVVPAFTDIRLSELLDKIQLLLDRLLLFYFFIIRYICCSKYLHFVAILSESYNESCYFYWYEQLQDSWRQCSVKSRSKMYAFDMICIDRNILWDMTKIEKHQISLTSCQKFKSFLAPCLTSVKLLSPLYRVRYIFKCSRVISEHCYCIFKANHTIDGNIYLFG